MNLWVFFEEKEIKKKKGIGGNEEKGGGKLHGGIKPEMCTWEPHSFAFEWHTRTLFRTVSIAPIRPPRLQKSLVKSPVNRV